MLVEELITGIERTVTKRLAEPEPGAVNDAVARLRSSTAIEVTPM